MNNKTFYKLGSLFLGIFAFVLIFLMVSPYVQGSDSKDQGDISFEDELRMHRQVFLRVSSSKNPFFSEALRRRCRESIEDINYYLYEKPENNSINEEYNLRREIREINDQITNEQYFSSENSYFGPQYIKI